ncbi:MAG: ABC transporter permease [Zetaproteobacteria bacterium]|nr:MAG: ABC transporter permease [Zetaproteobacteria bacterium]
MAIGLAAMLFLWGFNDGVHNGMTRNLQQTIVGSLQIHARGFFHHPQLRRTLPDPDRVARLLDRRGIDRRTSRLRTFALAVGGDRSEGLILLGVDPAGERRTTTLARKVDRGRFLRAGDGAACVVGATTARNLGLRPGDTVIVLTEDRFGAPAAERLRLVGIISSGEEGIDRGLAIVPLAFLQRLTAMEGRISEVVVQLPRSRLEPTTRWLRQRLGPAYEVLRWHDMYPMMEQWVVLENGFYYIFLSIVLVIIAAGVSNTVLMSMLERTREFGVMMALGCGRGRLAAMVVAESLILGCAGVALGGLIGLLLVGHFHSAGIDLSSRMGSMARFYIDPVIHTEIDRDHLRDSVLAVLAAAVVAALWPALRAARLEPVAAMRR